MPDQNITLNGSPHPLPESLTVAALLDALGMTGKPVVVELNREALTPAEHLTTTIHPGAQVELVTLAAGG